MSESSTYLPTVRRGVGNETSDVEQEEIEKGNNWRAEFNGEGIGPRADA